MTCDSRLTTSESRAHAKHDALRLDRDVVLDVRDLRQDAAEAVAEIGEVVFRERESNPAAENQNRLVVRTAEVAPKWDPWIDHRTVRCKRGLGRRLREADSERHVRKQLRRGR